MISVSERTFIRQGIAMDIRLDGRSNSQVRRRTECSGTLKHTPGSASVVIEGSSVLAVVQARVISPPRSEEDHGSEGVLEIAVDLYLGCLTTSAPSAIRNENQVDEQRNTLVSFLKSLFGNRASLNRYILCINPGTHVWQLNLDVMIFSNDGNIIDCAYSAATLALRTMQLPGVVLERSMEMSDAESIIVSFSSNPEDASRIDFPDFPKLFSFALIDSHPVMDPCFEEEHVADSLICLSFIPSTRSIVNLHKQGRGLFSISQLLAQIPHRESMHLEPSQ